MSINKKTSDIFMTNSWCS